MIVPRRMLAAFAVALALISCSPAAPQAGQPVAVTIGGPPNIALLAEIAKAKGYFAEEHIDATIQPIQTGKLTQDAVIAGQLDYGIVLDVNVAALGFRADNVVTLAALMSKGDDGLVARRDHGINGPADLAGKIVGRLTGTTSHVYIDRLLEQAGVDPARVTFRTMPPPAMQAALARGDIDAASLWEPFRLNAANALGNNALNLDGGQLYTARVLLIRRAPAPATRDTQEVRVVRALARAAAFARSNPAEAQAIVAPRLALSPAMVASIWHFYGFGVSPPDSARADVERIGAWVVRTQPDFAGRRPDYHTVLGNADYVRLAAE
jgi:ABC-type nitrate/sulfonate/bicarbonate transport system substrate-binding protein